ncbi:hypothetical protein LSH36_43g08037 [Paralvinella palmiformis]|uniref:BZIP domain-containing protein n=1 Tax=Paralvinella palmiformis TaxID=53620 RepID=A0AAD9K7G9_9ANNE|nr:hypothetical protein LSH36_43g08037 [Paralvinella palmiformis]
MALDLSAKTFGDGSKPPSPILVKSPSDCDTTSYDRLSTSTFSDLHDKHLEQFSESGFVGQVVKPMLGPLPSGHVAYPKSERLSPVSPLGLIQGGDRPFKSYPIEAMSTMYSQMAASAASMSAGMYGGQYGGAASPGLFPGVGVVENILSSPIAQYLQQKKRRSESRKGKNVAGFEMALAAESTPPGDESYHCGSRMPSLLSPGSCDDNQMALDDELPAKIQRTSSDSASIGMMSIEERRDESYWERRRKNNEAAKRSRDARRQKEEEIALRAAFLEQENLKLRAQVTILKNETAKLHYMLYNRM